MILKVTGVQWDADNPEDIAHLPSDVTIETERDFKDEDDVSAFLSDELSNQYGFTHTGWHGDNISDYFPNDLNYKEISDGYELCVFECNCGFHFGVDSSWLLQTNEKGWNFNCPACNADIFIASDS